MFGIKLEISNYEICLLFFEKDCSLRYDFEAPSIYTVLYKIFPLETVSASSTQVDYYIHFLF